MRLRTALLTSLPMMIYVQAAVAQDAPSTANQQPAAGDPGIGEILVTARKRAESLQDVSGSVQVVTSETLQNFNITSIDSAIEFIPNATFNTAPSGTPVLAVRGVGTRPESQLLEQDVGLFVDGVWFGRNIQLTASMLDVERVEVLRGAQAALYGRNTIAGAVSIVSKKPGDRLEGYVTGNYEFNYGSKAIEGAITIPLAEGLGVRLAGSYEDEHGIVRNTVLNRREADTESFTLRGIGVYETGGGTEFTARLSYSERDKVGNAYVRAPKSGLGNVDTFAPSPFPLAARAGYSETAFGKTIAVPGVDLPDVGSKVEFLDWSVKADIPLGDLTLTSITAASYMDLNTLLDVFLRTPGPRNIAFISEDYKQFTQDLQLTSDTGDSLEYMLGAFYLKQSVDYLGFQYVNEADRFQFIDQDVESWSLFANATYRLSDSFRLVGSIRYSDEIKEAKQIYHGQAEPALAFATVDEEVRTDFFTGSLTLEYDVNPDLMLFVSGSRGSKAPGTVNGFLPTNAQFLNARARFIPQEDVNTAEVGFKWEFGSGFLNATGFYMDLKNFQNASFVNGEQVVSSFDARLFGLEVDSLLRFNDRINLSTSLGLLDSKNKATGTVMLTAPSFTASSTLSYDGGEFVPGIGMKFSLNANYKSSYFINTIDDPSNKVGSTFLMNANAALVHDASGIEFSVFGKNLTDRIYPDMAFGAPFLGSEHIYIPVRGRTIGVEMSYRF